MRESNSCVFVMRWLKRCNVAAITMFVILAVCFSRGVPVSAATVIQTDVTAPAAGNVLVGVEGTYSSATKEAVLSRINEIRREACDQGLINPDTDQKLTAADYVPIKWSSDLEMIAQLRAAEATVYQSHTRTDGTDCFTATHNGVGSWSECLAWNYSGMMYGIEQWYEEKADWVKQNANAVTGHYTALISPGNTYIGVGTFQQEGGGWAATAAEFSDEDGLNEAKVGFTGSCIRVLEVVKSCVSAPKISGTATINPGFTSQLSFVNVVAYPGIMGGSNQTIVVPFNTGTIWQSSNPAVATVTSGGLVTALQSGSVTITAQNSSMGSASCTLKVSSPKKGMTVICGDGEYQITKLKQTVKLKKWKNVSGSVTIPASVKINGKSYKVTAIAGSAFKGNTGITKVTIGKNIQTIGSKAFYGCKSLKSITIKTTKLTSKSVGSKAFKGINARATIKVPSKKLASYKKILKAKGVGSKVKIKK